METAKGPVTTIDEYIWAFPKEVRSRLQTLRQLITAAAPEAVESISYQMPAFKMNGKNLVYFAAAKNHIGLYPTPSAVAAFQQELTGYKTAKGSIQFPMDKPLPAALIRKIVKFRVGEEKKKRKA